MKKLILAIAALFCIASCKKDTAVSNALSGKWEVRKQYGGFIIPPDSTYAPGNGNILQLNADSTYKRYAKGVLTASGVYHIVKNGYTMGQRSYDEISFDSDVTFKSVITLNNDMLTLAPLIPDVARTDYQKIGN